MKVKVIRRGSRTDLLIEGDDVSIDYNLMTFMITHPEYTSGTERSEVIFIPWSEILEVRAVD